MAEEPTEPCGWRCQSRCITGGCFIANGFREGQCLLYCKFKGGPGTHIPHMCEHGHQYPE